GHRPGHLERGDRQQRIPDQPARVSALAGPQAGPGGQHPGTQYRLVAANTVAASTVLPSPGHVAPVPRPGARQAFASVLHMADVTKAVIPAAGLGTRFLPATKATPKEMLPVVDKPAIQYVVEEAVAAGLDDVLLITGRSKHSIEDHFDRNY